MMKINYHITILLFSVLYFLCCWGGIATKTAVAQSPGKDPCLELLKEVPDDALPFAGRTTSSRERIASARAKAMAVQELVLFFNSAFIEGEEVNLFSEFDRLGNSGMTETVDPGSFRKQWSETSRELIAGANDSFVFQEKIIPDGEQFVAWQLLTVPQEWFRNHWKRSLAATDSSFYEKVKHSKYFEEIMEYEIRQTDPCEGLEK